MSVVIVNIYSLGTVNKNNKAVESIKDTLFVEAEEKLYSALASNEEEPIVNYNMGVAKMRKFEEYRDKDALNDSEKFFEKSLKDTSKVVQQMSYYNLGGVAYAQEKYAKAIQNYQKMGELMDSTKVDSDLAYNLASSIYKYAEKDKKADSLFTISEKLFGSVASLVDENKKSDVLYAMGNSAFKSNNFKNAVGYYHESLRLNPEDDLARENYEIALKKLQAQQQQNQQQNQQQQQEKSEKNKKEKQDQKSQSQEKQQKNEQEKKQDQYKDMSAEDKKKMNADKELDTMIQQQAQQKEKDKDKKNKHRRKNYSGRYW